MEEPTQIRYSFPESSTRRKEGVSSHNNIPRSREMLKTQVLPSSTVEAVNEQRAGETLLLESQERRVKPPNQQMWEGMQLQDDSTDCASGDTQILTESDDDLLDHKEGKSFLHELWTQKKCLALKSTEQHLEVKDSIERTVDEKRDGTLRPMREGSEQELLEVAGKPGLAEVVSSDAFTEDNENADGDSDASTSTTSGACIPSVSHKGVVEEGTSRHKKSMYGMTYFSHHQSCKAAKRASDEETGAPCTFREGGCSDVAPPSIIKQQLHDERTALPCNGVAVSGSLPTKDEQNFEKVARIDSSLPCTATSKFKLRNIASVRASALHTVACRAAERAASLPASVDLNGKQIDIQGNVFLTGLERSDIGHVKTDLVYQDDSRQHNQEEVSTSLPVSTHMGSDNINLSRIDISPTTNCIRQLCIDMSPVCSGTKKLVDVKLLQNPEIDVHNLAVVNAQTQAEECRSNTDYFAGQGRKVRKLLFEDGENRVEILPWKQQASAGLETEHVHANQMHHELKKEQDFLDPESHLKLNELSYLDSYEPGEETQSNALAMIDKLVWLNNSGFSEEHEILKGDRTEAASPRRNQHQLPQVGETKHSKETLKVFDWVDSQFGLADEDQGEKSKHANSGQCYDLGSKKLKRHVRPGKLASRKPGSLKKTQQDVRGPKPRNSSWLGTSIPSAKNMNQSCKFENVTAVDVKALSDPKTYSVDGGSGISCQKICSISTNAADPPKNSPQGSLAQVACTVMQKSLGELGNANDKPVHINERISYSDIGSDTQMALEAFHIMSCAREAGDGLLDPNLKINQFDADKSLEVASQNRVAQSKNRAFKGRKNDRRVSWSKDTEIESKELSTPETQFVPSKVTKVRRDKDRDVQRRNFTSKAKRLQPNTNRGQPGRTIKPAKPHPKCSGEVMCTYTSKAMEEPSTSKPLVIIGGVSTRSVRCNQTKLLDELQIQGVFISPKKSKKTFHTSLIPKRRGGANLNTVAKEVKRITKRSRTTTRQKQSKRKVDVVDSSGSVAGHVRAVVSAKEHLEEDAPQQKPLNFAEVAVKTQLPASTTTKAAVPYSGLKMTSTSAGQETEQQSTPSIALKEVSPSEAVKLRRRGVSSLSELVTSSRNKIKRSEMLAAVGPQSKLSDNKSKVPKNHGLSFSPAAPTAVEHTNTSGNPHKKGLRSIQKRKTFDTTIFGTPSNTAAVSNDANSIERKRRKREPGNANVLFSHGLSDEIVKQQQKIIKRLGGRVTAKATECTHFVTDKFVRTGNMLEVMAAGKPVVTVSWLESCGLASYFVDEKNFILKDSKKEKELGFFMQSTLLASQQKPLLQGWTVFVTPTTKPEAVRAIVKAAGGKVVDDYESCISCKGGMESFLAISCDEDYELCVPLLDKCLKVHSPELLFGGIVVHRLDLSKNLLFTNHSAAKKSRRKSR